MSSQDPLEWQAGKVEANFQLQEKQAANWLKEDSIWLGLQGEAFAHPKAGLLLKQASGFLLFRESKLLFWTKTNLNLSSALLDSLRQSSYMLYFSAAGNFYLMARSYEGPLMAVAAIGLPSPGVSGIHIQASPTPYPIHNSAGVPVFYLSPGQALPVPWQWPFFILHVLAAIGVIILMEQWGNWLSVRLHGLASMGLALSGALGITLVAGSLSFPGANYLEGLFSTRVLSGNLAQLVVVSLLDFWLLSFAQRRLVLPLGLKLPTRGKMALATAGYSGIVLFLLALSRMLESLVLESGLQFDFRNVFNLGPLSFTSVLSLAMLLFGLLLFSLWLGKGIACMGLSAGQRLTTQGASLLGIVIGIEWMHLPSPLGLLPFLLMALLFLALLDLFVDRGQPSLAWFTLWLAVLAAFGTAFLFKYSLDDNRRQRLQFALSLAEAKDSLAEADLKALASLLTQDTGLLRRMDSMAPDETKASISAAFQQQLAAFPYLIKNYQAEIFLPGQPNAPQLNFDYPISPDNQPGSWSFRRLSPNQGFFWYGLQLMPEPPLENSSRLIIAFRPNPRRSERVFQELLPQGIQHQYSFDYLVFFNGLASPQRGQFERQWLSPENWPESGSWRELLNSQRALLYYCPAESYCIIVKEELGGYIKPLSLFSYLFALLMLLTLVALAANQRLQFFPATPGMLFWGGHSLRHRIQLSVIGLSMAAFLLIGLITVGYFQNLFATLHQEQLFETVAGLARNLQVQGIRSDTTAQLNQLAEINRVDLLLYGLDGRLQASSAPFLFEKKHRAPRINPNVLASFRQNSFKPTVLFEQSGGLSFLSAYMAVPGSDGQAAYYLHIPYSSGDRNLQQLVLEFIGTLLSLYVFLLLIAGAIAIAVANSITRPLTAIGEKLRSLKLGKNEPLEWARQDEIGKLVSEYNQMAVKLEERTEELRQSEREGAWREMAKQVAHEIKNPLTPMKLSIQYLQQTQRTDPSRARGMIERVSKTLVEQIDGLARIASEFSDFAKMPQARNEHLQLNEVVSSVYLLFTEHQAAAEDIRLSLPSHPLFAFADRDHLVRVLTNLIKNAQQAIPEGRKGQIDIQLYQENGSAFITVSDNGSGIPEAVQPKVFQPNFTTKSSGMGLGLAMCKGMIEAAGGAIYFKTKADEGTEFFVELPLERK